MRKIDLIQRIVILNPDVPEAICRALVEKLFDAVNKQLEDGGAVELRGFGRFFLSQYAQRTVRNPWTGETLLKDKCLKIRFRASKIISSQINIITSN